MNYKVVNRKYSFPFMLEVVEYAEANSVMKAHREFKIPDTSIRNWIAEKDFLTHMADENNIKKYREEQDAIIKDRERIRKLEWHYKHAKEHRANNRDMYIKRKKNYYQKNKKKIREYETKRISKKTLTRRANVANSTARRRDENAYQIKAWDLWKIAKKQKMICPLSGIKLNKENMSVDHIIPASKGGSNEPNNIRLVDKWVNKALLDKSDEEFVSLCEKVLTHKGYKITPPEIKN